MLEELLVVAEAVAAVAILGVDIFARYGLLVWRSGLHQLDRVVYLGMQKEGSLVSGQRIHLVKEEAVPASDLERVHGGCLLHFHRSVRRRHVVGQRVLQQRTRVVLSHLSLEASAVSFAVCRAQQEIVDDGLRGLQECPLYLTARRCDHLLFLLPLQRLINDAAHLLRQVVRTVVIDSLRDVFDHYRSAVWIFLPVVAVIKRLLWLLGLRVVAAQILQALLLYDLEVLDRCHRV